jgi:hypothetical protein
MVTRLRWAAEKSFTAGRPYYWNIQIGFPYLKPVSGNYTKPDLVKRLLEGGKRRVR